MIMKSAVMFFVFCILSIVGNIEGTLNLEFLREFLFPRSPKLIRVKDVEEVLGDLYTVLDTAGLVRKNGYPAEEHKVTTEDGYEIVFYRIPGSPKSPPEKGKPVVFAQPGLFGSSDTWVLLGSNSLGFMLADAGYDVWLGNFRGNTYSRSHTNLTTLDKEFWNFSCHEIGSIDLPNMIDYALEYSGQKNFFYIGYSMGTTLSYILLSERPEYIDKMILNINLAPTVYWKNIPGSIYPFLIQFSDLIENIFKVLDIHDFAPQTRMNAVLGRSFCDSKTVTQSLCFNGLTVLTGEFSDGFNRTMLPYILSYFPAGLSTKILFHYAQNLKSGLFEKFNYGKIENSKMYGTELPPSYDLQNITTPVALFWGRTDCIALRSNTEDLAKKLQNVVAFEPVPAVKFNHFDFVMSFYAKHLLYTKMIELMSKIND